MRQAHPIRWLVAGAALVVIAAGAIVLGQRPGTAPEPTPTATMRPSPTPVPGSTLRARPTATLVAANIEFRPRLLEAPAGVRFVIRFRNMDLGTVHVVDVQDADGASVGNPQTAIDGGTETDYSFGPMPPGDYLFTCAIHPIPAMTGTLRVR